MMTLKAVSQTLHAASALVVLLVASPVHAETKVDRITTASVIRVAAPGADQSALRLAINALRKDDLDTARALRDGLAAGSLEHKTLSWVLAYFGGSGMPGGDIAAAAQLTTGWPGGEVLRANSEKALAREGHDAGSVITAFGSTPPQTFDGALALARALRDVGRRADAVAAISPFWRDKKLDADEEKAVIAEFGADLPRAIHRERMERMLYDDRIAAAGRVAGLAVATSLHKAWAAVIRRQPDASALLDAVPDTQRGAAFAFAKTRHLRRTEQTTKAAETMLAAPREAAALLDSNEWWNEQQILARDLIDLGKHDLAYKVAANHLAQTPSRIADAEFHAGWIALRFLKDAPKAARHFAAIAAVTDGPISRARAHYWLGRAAEAGGPGDARAEFASAARFATTFYGQLAAARIDERVLDIHWPQADAQARSRFEALELVQAARLLIDAGYETRAAPLLAGLAETLNAPAELGLLAVMAERAGLNKVALQIGKSAAYRGVDVGALTHPIGAIPEDVTLSGAGRALAHAVARQESEFHVGAVSGAGALGLLQLMPGTAKEVASRSGLPYSKARLTGDPGYNAALGARYLSEQIDRFDGSYILTFIAYNAGPRRAAEWVERYGSPAGKSLDEVVDWIELIPFAETRSYVQRVMENYQVYKWRLTGRYDIERDLRFGRD
jgi:soluble lytic murein transglycosylase